MTDLSGITVTAGILPPQLRESLAKAVDRIGAKMADTVRIDTTHFVTTEGRGLAWEKAVEMNIPVVRPEWVEGCERGGRIVGVRQYYLDADPRQRMIGMGVVSPGQQPTPIPPQRPESSRTEAPLPKLPEVTRAGDANGTESGKVTPESPPIKTSSKGEEVGDEDHESEEEEKRNTEPIDEQKVRAEDLDQHKVALHPAEQLEAQAESSKPADEGETAAEDQRTSGAASFQDVAL